MVSQLGPFPSGDVVSATASARPVLTFRNFSLRCDKSDPTVSFQTPWNWQCAQGKRIAVITRNSFLRCQLIASMSGAISPVAGEIVGNSVIGWPVGGEGGLDRKLRISHAVNFLSAIYSDCLLQSRVSKGEFWGLLEGMKIYPQIILKELSSDQKSFFYLALSVFFSFDCYLIPSSTYLMSKNAERLRDLLLKQLEGKTLFATSSDPQFQRRFCTEGLVLGSLGQILFSGALSEAIQWSDQNLEPSSLTPSEDDMYSTNLNFSNLESSDDPMFDFD